MNRILITSLIIISILLSGGMYISFLRTKNYQTILKDREEAIELYARLGKHLIPLEDKSIASGKSVLENEFEFGDSLNYYSQEQVYSLYIHDKNHVPRKKSHFSGMELLFNKDKKLVDFGPFKP